ncbi:MAG TPA: methyl-accepting chemotaxis protein [Geothrix sp.]|nr:methyl-accepting chemotaxis protein [Geothrix sp.]
MIPFLQSIRGKVFLMVVPPVLALTVLATFHATDRLASLNRITHLARMSELAITAGDAIHALQAERSATALYLSSLSSDREQAMKASRASGQQAIERMRSGTRPDQPAADPGRRGGESTLLSIEQVRRRVDAHSLSLEEMLDRYGAHIDDLLGWHRDLLRSSVGTPLESRLRALSTLQDLKEQTALDGAAVAGAFGLAGPPPGFAEALLIRQGNEQALLHTLTELLDASDRSELQAVVSGADVRELEAQRRQVASATKNGAPLAGDAASWMRGDAARLSALEAFESRLGHSLLQEARTMRAQAIRGLVLILLGTLFLQILLVAFAWGLSRHITRPMEHLAKAMVRLQEGDLTQALPAIGGDEVARMTLAFNHMSARLRSLHRQMLRAAREVAEGSRSLILNAERVNVSSAQLAQGALQEREHADHMTGAVHDLSASIDQVRRQMDEALEKTSLLKMLAERGEQASLAGESEGELLGRTFHAMIGIVREVDLRAAEIHLATEDQSRCNRIVAERVGEVNQQARLTLQAASQLANAAPEVLYTAKGLHGLAEGLAENAAAFRV